MAEKKRENEVTDVEETKAEAAPRTVPNRYADVTTSARERKVEVRIQLSKIDTPESAEGLILGATNALASELYREWLASPRTVDAAITLHATDVIR